MRHLESTLTSAIMEAVVSDIREVGLVGFFGKAVFSDGRWSEDASGGTYLSVEVHDSSIATVVYSPAGPAQGVFYLGFQPRDYFEDVTASDPVDLDTEASGLAAWAGQFLGKQVAPGDVRSLIAEDGVLEPDDVYVESTVERLLNLLDLPLPSGFPRSS